MTPVRISIFATVASLLLLLVVFELIRSRRLRERYALLWLATGVVLLVLSAWRGGLNTIAGAVGLARRSLPLAALVGGWFGAFALTEGASPNLPVDDGSFLAAFVLALPALALLVGAIPLLVPGVPRRLETRVSAG